MTRKPIPVKEAYPDLQKILDDKDAEIKLKKEKIEKLIKMLIWEHCMRCKDFDSDNKMHCKDNLCKEFKSNIKDDDA
jgi:hypothetical protein